jgi:hypothetical protein
MKKKTKIAVSVSLDINLSKLVNENITNRSKYIEYLIYQDMMKNQVEGIKNILL